MRIPNEQHASLPWRIAELAPDFTLEDAWDLEVTGPKEDFPRFVDEFNRLELERDDGSALSRWLFVARERAGQVFGWDTPKDRPIPDCRESWLRDRLPADESPPPKPPQSSVPFEPVFFGEREWVAEISNATVHAAVQLGWVAGAEGEFRGRLGVYVKPRGLFGHLYMKIIAPFRLWIVYPALMRRLKRAWAAYTRTAAR